MKFLQAKLAAGTDGELFLTEEFATSAISFTMCTCAQLNLMGAVELFSWAVRPVRRILKRGAQSTAWP